MKRAKRLMSAVLATGLFSITSCAQTNGTSSNGVINTVEGPMNAENYQKAKEAALAESKKEYEEMVRHPETITNRPPSEWPFPNFETGPGRPLPNYVNFYSMDDHFCAYLLCEYAVKEEHYAQTNESRWFTEALEQIRGSGPKRFPSLKWIAVAIRNVAEHKDATTFEQSFKVAAIFKADDIFDSSRPLSQLIAHADMDRHPFKYDTQQPTPGEQQRWLIVERHAATNQTTTGPVKP